MHTLPTHTLHILSHIVPWPDMRLFCLHLPAPPHCGRQRAAYVSKCESRQLQQQQEELQLQQQVKSICNAFVSATNAVRGMFCSVLFCVSVGLRIGSDSGQGLGLWLGLKINSTQHEMSVESCLYATPLSPSHSPCPFSLRWHFCLMFDSICCCR